MKLDRRIIEGKRPLSCLDTDEAKQFIGKEGYFADCLVVLTNIKHNKNTLTAIDEKAQSCFKDDDGVKWDYFLPAEWVQEQEPEPAWKPYDLDAWQNDYNMGRVITFRYTAIPNDNTVTAFYHGKQEHSADLNKTKILLGNTWYDFQKLFDEFEIFDNKYSDDNLCRWRPFGYQE